MQTGLKLLLGMQVQRHRVMVDHLPGIAAAERRRLPGILEAEPLLVVLLGAILTLAQTTIITTDLAMPGATRRILILALDSLRLLQPTMTG